MGKPDRARSMPRRADGQEGRQAGRWRGKAEGKSHPHRILLQQQPWIRTMRHIDLAVYCRVKNLHEKELHGHFTDDRTAGRLSAQNNRNNHIISRGTMNDKDRKIQFLLWTGRDFDDLPRWTKVPYKTETPAPIKLKLHRLQHPTEIFQWFRRRANPSVVYFSRYIFNVFPLESKRGLHLQPDS